MTMPLRFLLLMVIATCAGCVSTTTGRVQEPVSSEEAAQQYYQLGARYYRNGNFELARERLKRALELDSRLTIAHSTLALTYVQLGNLRLAEDHYSRAVRLEPSNLDARNAYAVFLCQQRRFDDANEQIERARRLDDGERAEIMLTNAGICMLQKPDLELAETYLREALEHRATHGEALLQLALLKKRQGENLAARAFLQRYLASNRATAEILWLAVQVECAIGDEFAGRDYRNRLLRDFPKSTEARRALQGDCEDPAS